MLFLSHSVMQNAHAHVNYYLGQLIYAGRRVLVFSVDYSLAVCDCLAVGPLVDVALELVYTGPGHSPTIECVVESVPKAFVTWQHNNSHDDIDFSQRLNIDSS